jgi:hypothetical protein
MRHFGAAALPLEFEKKSLAKFGGGAPFPDRPGVLAFSTHCVASFRLTGCDGGTRLRALH